jgi:hypothetical protein
MHALGKFKAQRSMRGEIPPPGNQLGFYDATIFAGVNGSTVTRAVHSVRDVARAA